MYKLLLDYILKYLNKPNNIKHKLSKKKEKSNKKIKTTLCKICFKC